MALLALLNTRHLRGKALLTFLHLPDPTKSLEERRRYIIYVVPFAVWSLMAVGASFYGFNVWLLPISLELYGSEALYTMRNGLPLYAFSSSGLMANVVQAYSVPFVTEWSSGAVVLTGIVLNALGLVLSGISVDRGSGVGLFFSQFFCVGTSLALVGYFTQVKALLWFREIQRPVVGAGVVGFGVGFWATTFSFWCPALLTVDGVAESFYYTAAIVVFFQIPAIFLLRSPDELPLTQPEESKKGAGEAASMSEENNEGVKDEDGAHIIKADEGEMGKVAASDADMANDSLDEVDSPPLNRCQFERLPQVHIQFMVWFLTFMTGFAPKYTISPIMSSVFSAPVNIQSITSFLFLFSYTFARIAIAFVIGPKFTIDHAVRMATALSPLCFFFMGSLVYLGKTEGGWMWAFTAANMIMAGCLGCAMVVKTPLCLKNWGLNNFKQMTARVQLALRLASIAGPVLVWSALSRPGDIYLDPSLNTSEKQQTELELSMGTTLLAVGGVGMLAFLGQVCWMRPYKG